MSWPFNVALVGAAFSVFSLIYNDKYIFYGFMTFIFGILCHLADTTYRFWLKDKGWKSSFVYISQLILTVLWILLLIFIYK